MLTNGIPGSPGRFIKIMGILASEDTSALQFLYLYLREYLGKKGGKTVRVRYQTVYCDMIIIINGCINKTRRLEVLVDILV